MGYEQTLEKVILRLDREEKEKDRRIAELEALNTILKQAFYLGDKISFTNETLGIHNLELKAEAIQEALAASYEGSGTDKVYMIKLYQTRIKAELLGLREEALKGGI
tara:strand:- start:161 stop:481 length:321 start_codon:yes stop_codon:yes gene_type:complete